MQFVRKLLLQTANLHKFYGTCDFILENLHKACYNK